MAKITKKTEASLTDKEKLDKILIHCISKMPADRELASKYGLGMADGFLDIMNMIQPSGEELAKAVIASRKLPKESE